MPQEIQQILDMIVAHMMIALIVLGVLVALGIAIRWIIFAKAGQPGWACIVPIYSMIVFMHIVGRSGWHILLFFIPIYGQIIFPLILIFQLARVFGHGFGFGLGLLFLPIIFFPILAFGSSRYVGPGGRRQPLPGYGDDEEEEQPRRRVPIRQPIPEDSFEEDEAPPPPRKPAAIKAAPAPKVKPAPAGDGKVLVQCSNCQKKLKVAANVVGKKVKCPGCGAAFVAS